MKYWLWTDAYPYDGFEDWGIYEFEYAPEDEYGPDNGIVKKVIISSPGALGIDEYDDMWDDATSDDPHRILKFLFEQEF